MSTPRAFPIASRLGLATATLMFGLVVIGSVVRTTGSGLACPDWPLCHGRLIPPLQFNVLIEWTHRLVALLVSGLLFATVGWVLAHRVTRTRLGGLAVLAIGLLALQVLLGALTVWRLLSPLVVSSHLAVALLLFATLWRLALTARAETGTQVEPRAERAPGLLPLVTLATLLVYAQAVLGGAVSTSGASLACPDWPTCNGEWLPALSGLAGLQVMHRITAYVVVLVMVGLAIATRGASDPLVRGGGRLALGLTLLQVVLGVSNVLMRVPVWLSALHLANAAAILVCLVTLLTRLQRLPAHRTLLVPAEAR